METTRIIIKTSVIGILLLLIGYSLNKNSAAASAEIELTTEVPRKVYKLGELIPVDITIKNNSSKVIYLPDEAVEGITIKISTLNGGPYRNYVGPGRGFTVDGILAPVRIEANGRFIKAKSILFNYRPDISTLSSPQKETVLKNRILSDYAFSEPGKYYIKTTLVVPEGSGLVSVESEPIQVTIQAPDGEDLEFWNKIKGKGEIAYFMQEGDLIRGHKKPEECAKFEREIAEILRLYPNGLYAETLRQSLVKFHASEAKEQESMQNMQRHNKPE